MSSNCKFEVLSQQLTAYMRERTPVKDLPDVMGKCYAQIASAVQAQGLQISGAPYTLYLNMDMQDLEVEIGFPVDGVLTTESDVRAGEIPSGRYASCVHLGPYSTVAQAYEALADWATEQAVQPSGVSYEFYLNDPEETPASELATRILFPLLPD